MQLRPGQMGPESTREMVERRRRGVIMRTGGPGWWWAAAGYASRVGRMVAVEWKDGLRQAIFCRDGSTDEVHLLPAHATRLPNPQAQAADKGPAGTRPQTRT